MPRNLHADVLTALDSDHIDMIALVKIEFDDVTIRLCNRLSSFTYNSEEYTGVGSFRAISPMTENIELDPSSCKIELSLADSFLLSTIANRDPLNKPITIYYALLDENSQLIGLPIEHFVGFMDEIEINYGVESSINITAGDQLADWSRRLAERLTHEDQIAKYPGDYGLEFVAKLANKVITWPKDGIRPRA